MKFLKNSKFRPKYFKYLLQVVQSISVGHLARVSQQLISVRIWKIAWFYSFQMWVRHVSEKSSLETRCNKILT